MATAREEMKRTGRLKLTRIQTLMHFFWVLAGAFALFPIFLITLHQTEVFRNISLIYLVLAGIYYNWQMRSLKFTEFKVSLTEEQFRQMFSDMVKELDWIQEFTEEGYIIATTEFRWTNWGTLVTLIRDKDRLLVNSICDLYKRPSTVSWGQNRKNINAVRDYIEKNFRGSSLS